MPHPAPTAISRRQLLGHGATLAGAAALGTRAADAGPARPAPLPFREAAEGAPNILLILTDQHQFETLGCMGHPTVKTPNLDRLAERGVLFRNAYCAAPACGPSRASIVTGMFPSAHGVDSNQVPILGKCRPDLGPELLRRAGYRTHLVGKLHVTPAAAPHGFATSDFHDGISALYEPNEPWLSDYVGWLADRSHGGDRQEVIDAFDASEKQIPEDVYRFAMGTDWRAPGEHSNDWVPDRAVEFLRGHDRSRPFFLQASFFGPHHPYTVPEPWASMYPPESVALPDNLDVSIDDKPIAQHHPLAPLFAGEDALSERQVRELLGQYHGQVSMIDHGIGRILDGLEARGLADDTVVVFTADHGDHAGAFGWFFKATCYADSVRVPMIIADPRDAGAPRGAVCDRVVNLVDLFPTLNAWGGGAEPRQKVAGRDLAPLVADPQSDDRDDETYAEFKGMNMVVSGGLKLMRYRRGGETFHELYDTEAEVQDGDNLWDAPDRRADRERLSKRLDELEVELAATGLD